MQARLDKLYDECADIEAAFDDAESKLESAKEKQVTTARIYEMLDEFREHFDEYDHVRKKEILRQVVDSVEINPDANPKRGDTIVTRVRFKCPVSFYPTLPEEAYDALGIKEFNRLETTEYVSEKNSRVDEDTVETVVLLSKGEIDSKKVRVEFSLENMDMSGFQKGATYPQIKEYVQEHSGLKVSSLYISQVKRKCGLDVGQNYNLSKKENAKQPQCPPEKETAIKEALQHFGMI